MRRWTAMRLVARILDSLCPHSGPAARSAAREIVNQPRAYRDIEGAALGWFPDGGRPAWRGVVALFVALAGSLAIAQSVHEAPPTAPSTGRVAPPGEPGQPLRVSGLVVGPDGAPIGGASLYVYQTDHEGYYSVKPASDNRNPRLKLFLRSDAKGAWAFETVKPGSYPNSRAPAHIHFQVTAPGRAPKIFEIVFDGDPFVTQEMRGNPSFSVRPITAGEVTERIVLN